MQLSDELAAKVKEFESYARRQRQAAEQQTAAFEADRARLEDAIGALTLAVARSRGAGATGRGGGGGGGGARRGGGERPQGWPSWPGSQLQAQRPCSRRCGAQWPWPEQDSARPRQTETGDAVARGAHAARSSSGATSRLGASIAAW